MLVNDSGCLSQIIPFSVLKQACDAMSVQTDLCDVVRDSQQVDHDQVGNKLEGILPQSFILRRHTLIDPLEHCGVRLSKTERRGQGTVSWSFTHTAW